LREAVPTWSQRECQCLILQLLGYTQEQAAGVLGIGRISVTTYLARALDKLRNVAGACQQ